MKIPTIHTNGTSRKSLTDALEKASNAIRAAQEALQETAPNARDYYPQGPDAICEAQNEHVARVVKLKAVANELMEIWEAIAD